MAPQVNKQENSRLFQLPQETRDEIYSLLFSSTEILFAMGAQVPLAQSLPDHAGPSL
jgi:hypothetical protein